MTKELYTLVYDPVLKLGTILNLRVNFSDFVGRRVDMYCMSGRLRRLQTEILRGQVREFVPNRKRLAFRRGASVLAASFPEGKTRRKRSGRGRRWCLFRNCCRRASHRGLTSLQGISLAGRGIEFFNVSIFVTTGRGQIGKVNGAEA